VYFSKHFETHVPDSFILSWVNHTVTYSWHPSRCWPRLRDHERHSTVTTEMLALWQGSITSLLYCPPHFPHIREASPKACRDLSLDIWHLLNNGIRRSWRHHRRSRTKPCPYPDVSTSIPRASQRLYLKQASTKHQSLRCHHFVTCSRHTSRCWPRSLQLNLRDKERQSTASPEKLAL
jgi:hypothetical protein